MSLDECYFDQALIEQAAWFFLNDTTRSIVIQHTATRTYDVSKLYRLVIANFAHTYHCKPVLAYNAICAYALCLVFDSHTDNAITLLERARYMYNYEYNDDHELLVLIYRILTLENYPIAYPATMSIQDKCARLITDMCGDSTDTFDENMRQMMSGN